MSAAGPAVRGSGEVLGSCCGISVGQLGQAIQAIFSPIQAARSRCTPHRPHESLSSRSVFPE